MTTPAYSFTPDRLRLIKAFAISICLHGLLFILSKNDEYLHISGHQAFSQSLHAKREYLTVVLRANSARTEHIPHKSPIAQPEVSPRNESVSDNDEPSTEVANSPFFAAKDLNRLPEALSEFDLGEGGVEYWQGGRILFRLWINDHGMIDRVDVIQSEVPPEIVSLAKQSLQRIQFRPGEINEKPVNCWSDIVIEIAPAILTNSR